MRTRMGVVMAIFSLVLCLLAQVANAQDGTADPNPYDHYSADGYNQLRWMEWETSTRERMTQFFVTCIMEGRSDRTVSNGAECQARPDGLPVVASGFHWRGLAAGVQPSGRQLEGFANPALHGAPDPVRPAHPALPAVACPAGDMDCTYARAILDYRNRCYQPRSRDLDTAHCPNDYGDLNRNLCEGVVVASESAACAPYATMASNSGSGLLDMVTGWGRQLNEWWNGLNRDAERQLTSDSIGASGTTTEVREQRDPRPRSIDLRIHRHGHKSDDGDAQGDGSAE